MSKRSRNAHGEYSCPACLQTFTTSQAAGSHERTCDGHMRHEADHAEQLQSEEDARSVGVKSFHAIIDSVRDKLFIQGMVT